MLKPTILEDCLISKESSKKLLKCNFDGNVLLKGRAGVGKTTICKIILKKYPEYQLIENIDKNYKPGSNKILATTTNLNFESDFFESIIIEPLSPLDLLKKLSDLKIKSTRNLYKCIEEHYPNINKILNLYSL
jgi:septin family protein